MLVSALNSKAFSKILKKLLEILLIILAGFLGWSSSIPSFYYLDNISVTMKLP